MKIDRLISILSVLLQKEKVTTAYLAEKFEVSKRTILRDDGVNLLNASDESAGQSVPHFHIHIIPRKTGDNIDAWPNFDGAKQDVADHFEIFRME